MRLFALAFVAGAFVLQQQRSLPEPRLAGLGLAAALACTLVPAHRRIACALSAIVCGALVGFGHSAWRAEMRLAQSLPPSLEGRDVVVTGIVSGLPQVREPATRFLFDVESWEEGVAPAPARLPGTLSLAWYARDGEPPPILPCERWRLTVRLKPPRGLANPHTFDFEAWALERGIRATGYVRGEDAARRIAERVDGWPCTLHRWRGEVRSRIERELPDAARRGVLVALAIGDQDSIPDGPRQKNSAPALALRRPLENWLVTISI